MMTSVKKNCNRDKWNPNLTPTLLQHISLRNQNKPRMVKERFVLKIIVFQLMALSVLLTWTKIYSNSHTVQHKLKVSDIGISSDKLESLDLKYISRKQVFFPLIIQTLVLLDCSLGKRSELGSNQSVFCPSPTLFTKSIEVGNTGFNWPVYIHGISVVQFKRNLLMIVELN